MIRRVTASRFLFLMAAVAVLSAAECPVDDPTNPPPPSGNPTPTTLVRVSGDGQSGTVGQDLTNPLVVRVDDQFGNPMSGISVSFSVTQGGGGTDPASATTDASGQASASWTLGTTAGAQQASASVTGVSSPAAFSATAVADVAATVAANGGDAQQVLAGTAVPVPPSVHVEDAHGNDVEGAEVTFAVASGGGALSGAVATSDASGVATVGSWTLGSGSNSLTATVAGSGISGNPVTFTAEGLATLFDIEIRFVGDSTPTTSQVQAFSDAVDKWESIIVGDLSDVPLDIPDSTSCGGTTLPQVQETVDDLLIYVELVYIDGQSGVLGQAGPCLIRSASDLPALGGMLFDTADLQYLENNGELDLVVMHEMGHVLGFGTLWSPSWHDLLGLPSDVTANPPGVEGNDTYFNGTLAIAAFDSLDLQRPGPAYVGNKVPVENDYVTYGPGSLDGHWRESVFDSEMMTSGLNSGVINQLSVVTVASLADMGYSVNETAADSYELPVGPAAVASAGWGRVSLAGDIWRGPVVVVDEAGVELRIVRW